MARNNEKPSLRRRISTQEGEIRQLQSEVATMVSERMDREGIIKQLREENDQLKALLRESKCPSDWCANTGACHWCQERRRLIGD